MARGNLLLGTARGSLGDITFYRYDSQQVSRVRVRKIKNPKTVEQLVPRIILTTVSKAYSAMQFICKDSFQGYSGAEKNMRRFLKVNNMQMKEMAYKYYYGYRNHEYDDDFSGNFNEKDTFKMVINPYFVSEGDLPTVPYTVLTNDGGLYMPWTNNPDFTYQDFCDFLGVPAGAQLTLLQLVGNAETQYVDRVDVSRIILSPASGGMSTKMINSGAVNSPNPRNEGVMKINLINEEPDFFLSFETPFEQEYPTQYILGAALIVSYYENGMWRRSSQYILCGEEALNKHNEAGILISMSDALDTWMKDVNSSMYLNQANTDTQSTNKQLRTIDEVEAPSETKTRRKKSN